MTNPAYQIISDFLNRDASSNEKILIIADENMRDTPFGSLPKTVTLLTNRFDVYQQAFKSGLNISFNDFDFSALQPESFDKIFYRVSKEKLLTHHIINQSKKFLKIKGQLTLIGEKKEGIKTYGQKAENYFQSAKKIKKIGFLYAYNIQKENADYSNSLESENYSVLRPELSYDDVDFISKPGVFGWKKIDQGSQFLTENLSFFFKEFLQPPSTILDLGCGYGFLSAMAFKHNKGSKITATDNNAAALLACEKNFERLGINGSVIASDCGENLQEKYEAVICNPPFHQGFGTSGDLTDRFLMSAHNHLTPEGKAVFVVNEFVPLERKAEKIFNQIHILNKNRSFKIILLKN